MVNKVKVAICGKDYMLQTEEPPSYVYGLAKMLEKKMNSIMGANSSVSQYSAAIMVALSTLDDLNKTQASLESVRNQAAEYVSEVGKARIEKDSSMKNSETLSFRVDELEREALNYQKTIRQLEKQLKSFEKSDDKQSKKP